MNTPILASPQNPTAAQGNNKAADLIKRAEHVDELEWLQRLDANADFQRFIEFVKERAASTLKKTGEVDTRTAEQREAYSQQYFALERIVSKVKEQIAASHATIKAIDDRLRKV